MDKKSLNLRIKTPLTTAILVPLTTQRHYVLEAAAYHELHEDGGHPRTVPRAHALEHVTARGGLSSVLLLDRPELFQHLHFGFPQVGRHVLVPKIIYVAYSL